MLTIKELIELLEKMPQDYAVKHVVSYGDEFDDTEMYDCEEPLWEEDIYINDEEKKITIWKIRV